MVDQVWAEQYAGLWAQGLGGVWGVLERLEGRLLFCQRDGDTVASGTGVKGPTQPPGT